MVGQAEVIQQELLKEQNALIELSRQSLLPFTLMTDDQYVVNFDHKIIAQFLDKLRVGDIKRLMIFKPPQTGKSEQSSRKFPAHVLGCNPNEHVAIISYSSTRAAKFCNNVQSIIDTEEYQEIFPDTKLAGSHVSNTKTNEAKRSNNYFEIVGKKGFLTAAGVDGGITGDDISLVICDDLVKNRKQANSPTYRQNTYDFYIEAVRTRLDNNSRELLLNTRWHHDDIAGRLIAEDGIYSKANPDGWVVLSFPAIKEPPSKEPWTHNPFDTRKNGEVLWPEKHSLKRMLAIKRKNPTVFSALYQQRPTLKEGNHVLRRWFKIIHSYNIPDLQNQIVDFVVDGAEENKKTSDPTGIAAYVVINQFLYILHVWWVKERFSDLYKTLYDIVERFGDSNSLTTVEPKSVGKQVVDFLFNHTDLNVVEWEMPTGSKLQRFNGIEAFVAAGRVRLVKGDWNKQFIDECAGYPALPHDEGFDLLTMATTEGLLRNNSVHDEQSYENLF